MHILQETTKWVDSTVNLIYVLNASKDKLLAYVVDSNVIAFSKPLKFSTSRRQFKAVKDVHLEKKVTDAIANLSH